RDLFLQSDGPAHDGGREIGVAIEELEVALGRARARGSVGIELAERRLHGEREAEVLHPVRVPRRLQEQRSPENAQEGQGRDTAAGTWGPSLSGHGSALSIAAAAMVAPKPRAANTGARGSRMARGPPAAASAQPAGHAPVSPEARRGGQAPRATPSSGENAAQAKQIEAVTAKGKSSPRRFAPAARSSPFAARARAISESRPLYDSVARSS